MVFKSKRGEKIFLKIVADFLAKERERVRVIADN